MRTWMRASQLTLCGGCPHWIKPNEPMLVVKLLHIVKPRIRCCGCADEEVPAELPDLVTTRPVSALVHREPGVEG